MVCIESLTTYSLWDLAVLCESYEKYMSISATTALQEIRLENTQAASAPEVNSIIWNFHFCQKQQDFFAVRKLRFLPSCLISQLFGVFLLKPGKASAVQSSIVGTSLSWSIQRPASLRSRTLPAWALSQKPQGPGVARRPQPTDWVQ